MRLRETEREKSRKRGEQNCVIKSTRRSELEEKREILREGQRGRQRPRMRKRDLSKVR